MIHGPLGPMSHKEADEAIQSAQGKVARFWNSSYAFPEAADAAYDEPQVIKIERVVKRVNRYRPNTVSWLLFYGIDADGNDWEFDSDLYHWEFHDGT